jgi:hypothetical protein
MGIKSTILPFEGHVERAKLWIYSVATLPVARLGAGVAGMGYQEECVLSCIVQHHSSAYIQVLARHD